MKFQGLYQTNGSKTKQNISNAIVPTYTLLKPYAIDTKTGEFLNKTSEPVLKKTGTKNIDEAIQSYKDSVDIYKLIERAVLSNDSSMLNKNIGTFADIVGIPDNINDFYAQFDGQLQKAAQELASLKAASSDTANSGLSADQVKELVNKMLQEQQASTTNNENNGGTN